RRGQSLSPWTGALRRRRSRPGAAVFPRGHPPGAALDHGDSLELLLLDHLLPEERLDGLRAGLRAAARAFPRSAVGGGVDVASRPLSGRARQAGAGRRRVARHPGSLSRHAVGEVRRRAARRAQAVTPFTIGIPVYNEEAILVPNTERLITFLDPLGREYEVLIGSNGSTDSTTALGVDLTRRFPQVSFFHMPERGVGLAFREFVCLAP